MKAMKPGILLICAVLFLLAAPAAAYIDPGTASLLFQGAYAVLSAVIAGLAFFFRPIKRYFLALRERFRGGKAGKAKDETQNATA